MAEERKASVWSQILVAVAITILAGTTAPWWWQEVRNIVAGGERIDSEPAAPTPGANGTGSAFDDADAVQDLYNRAKHISCEMLDQVIDGIRAYEGNPAAAPTSLAGTVFFPVAKARPTISDLATDRIARIRHARTDCRS